MRASEFRAFKSYVAATWPSAERWPDETWDVWEAELATIEGEAALEALRRFAREGREYPPTWGQVYQAAAAVRGAAGPSFAEADAEVRDTIDATERKLQWSHPVVALYVKEMGWDALRAAAQPDDPRSYGPWMAAARRVYDDCRRRYTSGEPVEQRLTLVPPSDAQKGRERIPLPPAEEPPPTLEAPESTEQGRRLREQYGLPPGRPEE